LTALLKALCKIGWSQSELNGIRSLPAKLTKREVNDRDIAMYSNGRIKLVVFYDRSSRLNVTFRLNELSLFDSGEGSPPSRDEGIKRAQVGVLAQ
jgi:hypothetical protein